MPSRRTGRPPLDSPRSFRVVVAFTAEERDELEDVRQGKPFATHVHDLALEGLRSLRAQR